MPPIDPSKWTNKEIRQALREGREPETTLEALRREKRRRAEQKKKKKKATNALNSKAVNAMTKSEIEALLKSSLISEKRRLALQRERLHKISGYYKKRTVRGGAPS